MQRRYRVIDVFTQGPLTGNALAVVLDCEGLHATAMQAIAREFNLSDTVFVLPAENAAHSARVRIFTPGAELPFAGYSTVGAAVCLALERVGGQGDLDALIVLEESVGPVRCGVKLRNGGGFAEFDCPKLPEQAGEAEPKEFIAAALDIAPAEIGFENHVPSVWSAGVPFHFVPVRNMAVLARAAPVRSSWPQAFRKSGAFLYTRETEGFEHSFRARMFARSWGSRRTLQRVPPRLPSPGSCRISTPCRMASTARSSSRAMIWGVPRSSTSTWWSAPARCQRRASAGTQWW